MPPSAPPNVQGIAFSTALSRQVEAAACAAVTHWSSAGPPLGGASHEGRVERRLRRSLARVASVSAADEAREVLLQARARRDREGEPAGRERRREGGLPL